MRSSANPTPSQVQARRAALFCAIILCPCLLFVFGVPFAVRTDWFARGKVVNWVAQRDYPYEVTGANADVVIFGDSSALSGINPLLMERDLGVTVVNLSPILAALSTMQDKPLAAYLRHNKPPRLIVVYLSAWNTGMPPDWAKADGMVVMMRHGTLGDGVSWVVRHPVEMLNQDMFLATLVIGRIAKPQAADSRAETWRLHGFAPYPGNLPHLKPDCHLGPTETMPADAGAWPQRIISRYQTPETRVVFYLAPLPACAGAEALVAAQTKLQPAPVNQLTLLPPATFLDDTYFAHPHSSNVALLTSMLTDALRPILRGPQSLRRADGPVN